MRLEPTCKSILIQGKLHSFGVEMIPDSLRERLACQTRNNFCKLIDMLRFEFTHTVYMHILAGKSQLVFKMQLITKSTRHLPKVLVLVQLLYKLSLGE